MELTEGTVVEKTNIRNLLEEVDHGLVTLALNFLKNCPIIVLSNYGENAVFGGGDGRGSPDHFIGVVFVYAKCEVSECLSQVQGTLKDHQLVLHLILHLLYLLLQLLLVPLQPPPKQLRSKFRRLSRFLTLLKIVTTRFFRHNSRLFLFIIEFFNLHFNIIQGFLLHVNFFLEVFETL